MCNSRPSVEYPGSQDPGSRIPRTSLADCLLATLCAYICWSGALRAVADTATAVLTKTIDICRRISEDTDGALLGVAVTLLEQTKNFIMLLADADFAENDHGTLYVRARSVINKMRSENRYGD